MVQTDIDIVSLVRDAAIVGAGGAGFPTHTKLNNKVDTIIANGGDVNEANEQGVTALHEAAVKGHDKMVLFLLEKGADRSIENHKNKTAWALARERGHGDIACKSPSRNHAAVRFDN